MAKLRLSSTGQVRIIPSESTLGRSKTCEFEITGEFVSSVHATIQWSGSSWVVRDLGSRNGTFVDGNKLEAGQMQRIRAGSTIGLGAPEADLELVSDEAPGVMAKEESTGEIVLAQGRLLALPSASAPELSVYPARDGSGWVVERDDGSVVPVADREVLAIGDRRWRIELPSEADATPMVDISWRLSNSRLSFLVSRDEERVDLTLATRGERLELESREHLYLVLNLARARAADMEAGVGPSDAGWRTVDEIMKMLRIDASTVNVLIHRARQQLASADVEDAASIIEVRRGARRIGTTAFEIRVAEE